MEVDPYKLFGLTKDFTIDELKTKFKALAITTHPDKGGSEGLFRIVIKAFKKLVEDYNIRISNRTHQELKNAFEQSQVAGGPPREAPVSLGKGDRFNLDKFNKLFDENRMEDAYSQGYKDWMEKEALPEVNNTPKKPVRKFNVDVFNNNFEKTAKPTTSNKFVTVYKEPEPLLMSKKIQYTELGVEKVDDYSADNTTRRNLNFMDYKVAHTTTRIVDPATVKRKEYATINELEGERSRIQFNMSKEDYEYEMRKKRQQEDAERQRLETMERQRRIEEAHFEKLQRLVLK